MASESEQHERETTLLMYAADEMSAAERAEFERRLASDPQLAAELQQLRAAQQRVEAGLAELDQQQRPPVSDAVAVRRAARAMQQWQLRRSSLQASPPAVKALP